MSRYLFVVPPFPSHIYPTVAVAHELVRHGHVVAWVTYDAMRHALPEGAMLYALDSPVSRSMATQIQQQAGATWMAGMKVLFEQVVMPMARDMLPGIEAAIESFHPDALIVDQQTVGGALAARRKQLPWATSAPTAALIHDRFSAYPKVEAWIVTLFDQLQRDAGVEPVRWPDRSPALVLIYMSRMFCGTEVDFPAHYRFVGPAVEGRVENIEFPWQQLREGPRIFVSLGTLLAYRGERFFRILVEALADAPLQVVVHAPPEFFPRIPDNFIVRPWVPLLRLLPELDAIVCHAGTTVNEGLLHGIPAVLAPVAFDQAIFAERAVATGAALRVQFNRVTAPQLRDAVLEVLDNPAYRAAAKNVQASFREAGGAAAAAAAIEQLQ
jgi:MGT family glycosyltransferase